MHYVDYYFDNDHNLSSSKNVKHGFEEYTSDPADPVPYTNGTYSRRNNEYMVEDQRFARSDLMYWLMKPIL